ncbi:MAG: carbohydrate kinase family protein [Patescibacteria group bacterium]
MGKKEKKYEVISVGGVTRDILFYSGEGELLKTGNLTKQRLLAFEYGAKILADKIYLTFGGGAANTSASFAKMGLKAAIVSRVGDDDNGYEAIKNLAGHQVNTSLIKKSAGVQTAFSLILTISNAAKEHIAFIYRGASDLLSSHDLISRVETDWYYVSSLPKKNWEGIMSSLIKTGKNIAWNPGGEQLQEIAKMKKFLSKIKLFVVNRDEALEFKKLKDIKGLIRHIHGLGPKIVVITDGASGAYAFDGKKYYFMKVKAVKAVNTLGVGDAFNSAFTAALIYGKNIKEALKWGMNNSASVVTHIGAQKGLLNRRQAGR